MPDTPFPFNRRTLLKALGGTLAAGGPFLAQVPRSPQPPSPPLPFAPVQVNNPPWLAATERQNAEVPNILPPEQRVRYAVVGLGRIALTEVLPALRQCRYSRLTALVSGSPTKLAQIGAEYGITTANQYSYETFNNIQGNSEIDVVYIALPNSQHADFTVRAAQAGKHVLCEKPMATTVAECDRMIAACRAVGKQLMIAYRIQYEPYNQAMQNIFRSNNLGSNVEYTSEHAQNMGDPNQWRLQKALAGGGALYDIGIYNLNTVRFLTGEEPTEIVASVSSPPNDPRFREVEATVNFRLRFPSGFYANNFCTYAAHQGNRYRLYASDAWAQLDPAYSYRGLMMEGSRKLSESFENVQMPRREEYNQFALEIDHMSLRMIQNRPVYTPGEEGRQDIFLMQQIYQAAATNQPVMLAAQTGRDLFRGPAPEPFQ